MENKMPDQPQVQPQLARFRATSSGHISNGAHAVSFITGQECMVHKSLFSEAITAGLMPMDELAEGEVVVRPLEMAEKQELIVEACQEIIARGAAQDFTSLGKPKVSAVHAIVGFDFSRRFMLESFEQAIFRNTVDASDDNRTSGN